MNDIKKSIVEFEQDGLDAEIGEKLGYSYTREVRQLIYTAKT